MQGNLAGARTAADQAYRQFSGHDPYWAWKFRILEADILTKQGQSRDVLSSLQAEIPSAFAGSDLEVRQHMLQALAYSHLGEASRADQNLQEAQRQCDLTNCAAKGEVARIAGAIESERNNSDKAEGFFRASLQIARQQGDKFLEASDLLNLGVVAIGKEHFDESVDWSDAASTVAHAIHANLTEEKALGNLGWAYYKMGDFDKSLDCFVKATKSSQELGAVIDSVEWLNNQGLVYFQEDQFGPAEDNYRQSLELARASQNKIQMIAAITALAFVSLRTGRTATAKQYSDEAFQLAHEERDRPDELYALLAQGEIAAQSGDTKRAAQLLSEVAQDRHGDTSLRWQAQGSLANLYASESQPAAADREYRESLSTLEAARSSLRHEEFRLPFLANASHLYGDYVRFLVKQGKIITALQIADFSRAQTLLEGLGALPKQGSLRPTTLNAQSLARGMGGTILFYWLGQDRSFLWVVTGAQTGLFQLPGQAEIENLVLRYNQALNGPADVLDAGNPDGSRLYDLLVAPAESFIPHNSRIFIIPDGSLNRLNFETLLAPKPYPHFWIEDVVVTNANSLRLLAAANRQPARRAPNLLLIGDAVAATSQFSELPNAAGEMTKIAAHFPPNAKLVLQRTEATAEAYLAAQPEHFSYIHFVAHGTASQLSPLDSAIVLSKSPNSDSFKLYASDIIQHPLNADLVTISSCYGEGARAYTGEGLVGLSWAFLRAGAHNVIGALWEVSDTSTPQLMDRLYAELEKDATPALALHRAKLQMLHSASVFRKPYYWAPFQLYTGF